MSSYSGRGAQRTVILLPWVYVTQPKRYCGTCGADDRRLLLAHLEGSSISGGQNTESGGLDLSRTFPSIATSLHLCAFKVGRA